jgi:hypothetical protein
MIPSETCFPPIREAGYEPNQVYVMHGVIVLDDNAIRMVRARNRQGVRQIIVLTFTITNQVSFLKYRLSAKPFSP